MCMNYLEMKTSSTAWGNPLSNLMRVIAAGHGECADFF